MINLRYVTAFVQKQRFKYEDSRTALSLIQKGDFMCTFDLKSGYHHIDIHEQSQTYLGFSWKGDYYIFTVLPFGLSTACYVFTKMLRPLIRHWRGKGIGCVLYIDDGIAMAQGREEANTESKVVKDSLEAAGLVVNEEKSCWAPSQEVVWLEFIWNTGTGCICIPEEKLENLKGILQEVEKAPCIRAKQLASITGKIISMGLAVGPVARLRTRNMYCLLNTRQSWQDLLQIEENVKDEFTFWVTCVDKYNGQKLWRSPRQQSG